MRQIEDSLRGFKRTPTDERTTTLRSRDTLARVKLEWYSEQFAKRLFQWVPHWKAYTGHYAEGEPGLLDYFLDIHIPPANPHVDQPLRIYTGRDQDITISWIDGWHAHFDPWSNRIHADTYIDQALYFLEALISERMIVINLYQEGKPAGGGYMSVDHLLQDTLPTWVHPKPGYTTILRTWRGTHDCQLLPDGSHS